MASSWRVSAIFSASRSFSNNILMLAVSLGQIKILIEAPYSMTHAAMPDDEKRARGLVPDGIRLSIGLEDWHDIIADLRSALEHV